MDLSSLLGVTWSPISVLLVFVFVGIAVFGFFIMFKEIKIIKRDHVKKRELVYATVFGIIFSAAIMMGIGIVVQYVSTSVVFTGTPYANILLPSFTSLLLLFLTGVLAVYPLIEFIAMALDQKQGSPFFYQELLHRHVFKKVGRAPVKVALAVLAYAGMFHLPPLVLQLTTGVPYFFTLLMLVQFFPVFLLSKLGSQGYFWGVNLHYYNIMEKERLVYTAFDHPKHFFKALKESTVPLLALPVMIFTYVNTFYSLAQMFELFNPGTTTRTLNFTFVFSTTINVLFQLVGFYNRYWKKQVKYRMTEIVFAGYLFCSLSLNILLNFLVKQPDVLLASLSGVFSSEINQDSYMFLMPVAMIQKTVFVVLVTWYFLSKKGFKTNVLRSIMMLASSRLNPRPLASLMRHKDETIKQEAIVLFTELYRSHSMKYIPPPKLGKRGKNPFSTLLAGLARGPRRQVPFEPAFEMLGSEVLERRQAAAGVLKHMLSDDPYRATRLVNEHMVTGPALKHVTLLGAIVASGNVLPPGIDFERVAELATTGDVDVARTAVELLAEYYKAGNIDETLQGTTETVVRKTLDSPCTALQEAGLFLLQHLDPTQLADKQLFSRVIPKLDHPDQHVRQAAIAMLDKMQDGEMSEEMTGIIISLLDEKAHGLQLAALSTLQAITRKRDVRVPLDTMTLLMESQSHNVSMQAASLFITLSERDPIGYPVDMLLPLLQTSNPTLLGVLLPQLGSLARHHGAELVPVLGAILDGTDTSLKDMARPLLVDIGKQSFEIVLERILAVKEDSRFSVRNYTREILVEIGKEKPRNVLPILQAALVPEDKDEQYGNAIPFLGTKITKQNLKEETFRINAAAVIGDIGSMHPDSVSINALLEQARKDPSWRVRKELVTSLGKVMARSSGVPLNRYMELYNDENTNVRTALVKGLVGLARERPGDIQVDLLGGMMEDTDESVREQAIKILALVARSQPDHGVPLLLRGLHDAKWPVRNAAAEGLGSLASEMADRVPVDELKDMFLHDKDQWTRWQAGRTLIDVIQKKPGVVRLEEIEGKIDLSDEKMAMVHANLLRHVSPEPMKRFLKTIRPLMVSSNEKIQDQATTTLYHVHGKTRSEELVEELLKLVVDEGTDINVLHCAAIALGKMVRYDTGELRKRVKKVLGTRAKLSRDFILSREFSAL